MKKLLDVLKDITLELIPDFHWTMTKSPIQVRNGYCLKKPFETILDENLQQELAGVDRNIAEPVLILLNKSVYLSFKQFLYFLYTDGNFIYKKDDPYLEERLTTTLHDLVELEMVVELNIPMEEEYFQPSDTKKEEMVERVNELMEKYGSIEQFPKNERIQYYIIRYYLNNTKILDRFALFKYIYEELQVDDLEKLRFRKGFENTILSLVDMGLLDRRKPLYYIVRFKKDEQVNDIVKDRILDILFKKNSITLSDLLKKYFTFPAYRIHKEVFLKKLLELEADELVEIGYLNNKKIDNDEFYYILT
jgi:hypothetical protein